MKPNSITTEHALAAWRAGLESVDAAKLVRDFVVADLDQLHFGSQRLQLDEVTRIRVVGAGKATYAMWMGLREALGPGILLDKTVSGWINIPEFSSPTAPTKSSVAPKLIPKSGRPSVWAFEARPAAENLPTLECYGGTLLMEDIVKRTGPDELCVALISGGGSALLAHPVVGVSIDDVRKLTTWMSANKASIRQMNTVRQQISQVKGGKLARRLGDGQMVALVISDVLGDPLEWIASGPTVACSTTPEDALAVLRELDGKLRRVPTSIRKYLESAPTPPIQSLGSLGELGQRVTTHLIGNLDVAVRAAKESLEAEGYVVQTMLQTDENETAIEAANRLVVWLKENESTQKPLALVSGGEPVVELCKNPGNGGRNMHLVLQAIQELLSEGISGGNFCLLSGGTDCEDGTVGFAGAMVNGAVLDACEQQEVKTESWLKRCDSFGFFQQLQTGLLAERAGKRQTNVGDLRIVVRNVCP